MSTETQPIDLPWREPGRGKGLAEVFYRFYLLKLIVHKDLRVRYRGSILGMLWSYVKPAVQFIVFYFAVGEFLRMNDRVENYAIYLFSGIVIVNFFTESFGNATRSIAGNYALVKKIYLPRELFPVSALWVAAIHFFPQLVVLIVGALLFGWSPTVLQLLAAIGALIVLAIFCLGLGLLFGAINVLFRDAENLVDLLVMVATWASPVLYTWQQVFAVSEKNGGWLFPIYMLNPITPVVEVFHWAFWEPTQGAGGGSLPPNMAMWMAIATVISLLTLWLGEYVFRRLDGRFAQEL
ncbi:ABC-2 type transport system permease protein [Bowdeniella nasicola]|uniref:Transport permease protein n=1 Tax=Bowdeniella nasicola TaxID=208480 RepID=A0A1H3VKH3_9ACTO|nr:ABC transporter permease [Bowdeniella nasicola]SDZ75303.1 ABC-2 type transport system permease protein [Bowdeniella nasicola]